MRVFVVWEPMLPTDWSPPGVGVLARVTDRRAAQYWDEQHLVSAVLARTLANDPGHPRPRCCEDGGILWDMVGVYPRGERWDDTLPRAALLDGPVYRAIELESAVKEQLAAAPVGVGDGP